MTRCWTVWAVSSVRPVVEVGEAAGLLDGDLAFGEQLEGLGEQVGEGVGFVEAVLGGGGGPGEGGADFAFGQPAGVERIADYGARVRRVVGRLM
jgi:hypothetical protein